MSRAARYSVGIDLGTTHCVIARGDPNVRRAREAVDLLEVAQLQAAGEVIENTLLPSFFYLPGPHELPEGSTDLPWGPSTEGIVGEMARRRVIDSPDRVVHSAKSWLCHDGVDRRRPFLPRSPAELERRVSPVEASAAYLSHLRRAWDHNVARGDKSLALGAQDILLTVPASFGEAARQLTVESARLAGLKHLHLVEEPQAAFYSWLASQGEGEQLEQALEGLSLILVVDVGGGTTDLTLIRVARDEEGEPNLERVAVGEHLMLGGDNMDLALAGLVEPRLSAKGSRLDGRGWQALRQSCRIARETLLAESAPEAASVVVPGRGSRLMGGMLRAELERDEVVAAILDGFFPKVRADVKVEARQGIGLREWGLPYAHDVAVTRHVAAFLRRYRKETKDRTPLDAVLFNGGVLNSPRVAARLMDVIREWTPKDATEPRLLTSRSLDLAVALGAAHYGLVRRGLGLRIVSGLSHAVFVGLEVRKKRRGGRKRLRRAALCLAPRGLAEGETVELKDRPLNLTVGREVVFPLFELRGKGGRPGDVRTIGDPNLEALPPIRTRLPGSGRRQIPVKLQATLSEVGTLEVVAVTQDGSDKFQLEFDMRGRFDTGQGQGEDDGAAIELGSLDPDRVEQAMEILKSYFSEAADPPRWKLVPRLEKTLKSKRDNWPLPTVRGFFEALRPDKAYYMGPPEHQAAWYNITGYCLRPGFGFAGDKERMELMLPVLKSGCRVWDARARSEWWVLWRRLAGGLNRKTQEQLFATLLTEMGLSGEKQEPLEAPARTAQEFAQMWMLAASLERVSVKSKSDLGELLLKSFETEQKIPQGLWCLARLGARVPFHGGIETVLPTDRVEGWIRRLLELTKVKKDRLALALMMLSRRTDDRSRDIDEELRALTLDRMTSLRATSAWITMVQEVVEDEALDTSIFGESLPPGLRLMA